MSDLDRSTSPAESDAERAEHENPGQAKKRERMPTGTATDDTAGGDDMMAPGKSTASLPEFR
jgi:hypothetical protein